MLYWACVDPVVAAEGCEEGVSPRYLEYPEEQLAAFGSDYRCGDGFSTSRNDAGRVSPWLMPSNV